MLHSFSVDNTKFLPLATFQLKLLYDSDIGIRVADPGQFQLGSVCVANGSQMSGLFLT